jgi:lipoyl(octanoyl) transferase
MNPQRVPLAPPLVSYLGCRDYAKTQVEMREFTQHRSGLTTDALWLCEHPAVYTLGQATRAELVPAPGEIPVVQSDRGGQITYHGPGQVVAYLLLDIARRGLRVRDLVHRSEQAVIDLLASYGLHGDRRIGAPGVYVGAAKIAAIGFRIRHGFCYHGLALNVAMDLAPFHMIDPCGYAGLAVTQLADLGVALPPAAVAPALADSLCEQLQT